MITDSKSLLMKIPNLSLSSGITTDLAYMLHDVAMSRPLCLGWTKGHAGTDGNERADALCEEAHSLPAEKASYNGRWARFPKPPKHLTSLHKDLFSVSIRIRSGHCRLPHHTYRLGITGDAPLCPRFLSPAYSPEHYLFDCMDLMVRRERFTLMSEGLFEDTWVARLFQTSGLLALKQFFRNLDIPL
jgi:hypothetical protein